MKTVVMLRNNDTPDYDMRPALQSKALEEAGYDVYQIFVRLEKGLNIWCIHGDESLQWTDVNWVSPVYSKTMQYCNMFKPLVVIRNYLTMKIMQNVIKTILKGKHIDIVHAHNLDTMPLAIKLKKEYGCKIVYDMREMYAFMAGRDLSSVVDGYYLYKDKQMWKHADYVFTMEDVDYDWLPFLRAVTSKKRYVPVTTVSNSRPLQYERYRETNNKKFYLLFLGTISSSRFLKEAIEVVEEFRGKIKFILGGNFQSDKYYRETIAMAKKAKHTEYIGQIPHSQVVPMTRRCDAVFCMIDPAQKNNARAMANKQHEAMIAGRPIITTIGTHSGDMTIENNCGYVIPHEKRWLRMALHEFLATPEVSVACGMNGLKAAKEKHNWGKDKTRMLKAYKELLK